MMRHVAATARAPHESREQPLAGLVASRGTRAWAPAPRPRSRGQPAADAHRFVHRGPQRTSPRNTGFASRFFSVVNVHVRRAVRVGTPSASSHRQELSNRRAIRSPTNSSCATACVAGFGSKRASSRSAVPERRLGERLELERSTSRVTFRSSHVSARAATHRAPA